ncbi:5258_t:CDS:1, partial [Entrophospora sp. SA101]
ANSGAIVLPLDEETSDDDLEKCVKMLFLKLWLYNEQLKLLEEMTSSSPDSKHFKSS